MKNVYAYISEVLAEENIVKKNDVDICKYGLEMFVLSFVEIFFILILSLVVKNFFNTLIFLGFFIPLRIYAGGYHANTKIKCFLVFLVTYALFTTAIQYLPHEFYLKVSVLSIILSILMVLIHSPIINHNKKVFNNEIKMYRKKSILIVMLQSIVIIIGSIVFPSNDLLLSATIGQLTVSISMVAAVIKNKLQGGVCGEKTQKSV